MPTKRGRSASRSSGGRKLRRNLSYGSMSRREDKNLSSAIIVKPGSNGGRIYRFSRWCDGSPIYSTLNSTSGGIVITANSPDIIFEGFGKLDLLPNYAEFQALFSQYRVTEMEYHFLNCMYTSVDVVSNGTNGSNTIRNFPVYIGTQRDVLQSKTIAQMQQEDGVTVRDYVNNGKPLIIKVKKPTIYMPALDPTTTVPFSVETHGQWIDTENAACCYRGVYLGMQDAFNSLGAPTVANRAYTVRIKLTLEFRGVR